MESLLLRDDLGISCVMPRASTLSFVALTNVKLESAKYKLARHPDRSLAMYQACACAYALSLGVY